MWGVSLLTSPIMPFLPSTYKMPCRCGYSIFFFLFFSIMQLKTLDCSRLFGFLTPIMWFLPKNTDTHSEQYDDLLICFLMVLSLETEKFQRTLLWFFTPFNLCFDVFWCISGLLQNGYLEIDHINQLGNFRMLRAPQGPFFVYKLGSSGI